jgi:hypothetical protein
MPSYAKRSARMLNPGAVMLFQYKCIVVAIRLLRLVWARPDASRVALAFIAKLLCHTNAQKRAQFGLPLPIIERLGLGEKITA